MNRRRFFEMIGIAPVAGLLVRGEAIIPKKRKVDKSQIERIKEFDKSFVWKTRLRVENIKNGERMYIWSTEGFINVELLDGKSIGRENYVVIEVVHRYD